MLEAKKSKWFENIFAIYNRNLFKRRFNSLKVLGLETLISKNDQLPLVIYANHSSWWDGLVAFEISRRANLDSFIMMEEKQLKQFPLFRKVGAFSIVKENPRQSLKSVNYAASLLCKEPNRTLWIFPQGEILPNDSRPLNFYRGISKIIEKQMNCSVLPLAIRYEFLGNFKPEVFVKIGKSEFISMSENFDRKTLTKQFERNLTRNLDELKTDVLTKSFQTYQNIL